MKSKGEQKVIKAVKQVLGNTRIIKQHGIGQRLTIDVYLPAYNIGIEYDGIQHFERVEFFHESHLDFLDQQNRDAIKDDLCKQLGISLIRIPYTEDVTADSIALKLLDAVNFSKPPQEKPNSYKERQREWRRKQYEKAKEYRSKRLIQYKSQRDKGEV